MWSDYIILLCLTFPVCKMRIRIYTLKVLVAVLSDAALLERAVKFVLIMSCLYLSSFFIIQNTWEALRHHDDVDL